jgi:DNA repair exonuclease SbcCD nuclease subunit
MTRILASGDWHARENGLYPGWLAEQEAVFNQVIDHANREDVDAVLLCGDLFDRRNPSTAEIRAVQRALERLDSHIDLVAIPGNGIHDGNYDGDIALDIFNGGAMRVFRRPGMCQVGDVTVCALPWTPDSHLVAAMGGGERSEIHLAAAEHLIDIARGLRDQAEGAAVLMTHFAISGAGLPTGLATDDLREPVLPLVELIDLGFVAVIASHIHKGQILETDPLVAYTGAPMPMNHGDREPAYGCLLVNVGVGKTECQLLPCQSRPFLTVPLDGRALADGDVTFLRSFDGAVVRAKYSCTREQAEQIDQRGIRQQLLDAGAWHVQIEADIVREQRARAAGLTEDIDAVEAMGRFLEAEGIAPDRRTVLVERAREYMEAAR